MPCLQSEPNTRPPPGKGPLATECDSPFGNGFLSRTVDIFGLSASTLHLGIATLSACPACSKFEIDICCAAQQCNVCVQNTPMRLDTLGV